MPSRAYPSARLWRKILAALPEGLRLPGMVLFLTLRVTASTAPFRCDASFSRRLTGTWNVVDELN